ncbi:MAG: hypothetical protein ACR9NN_22060 [Nostochopsis sp.]
MPTTKFQPDNQVPYDKVPVQFKVLPGVREKLKAVPDWQERLRNFVDELIVENLPKND